MSVVQMSAQDDRLRLQPRRYRDGEEFFQIDWSIISSPYDIIMDYSSQEDHKGIYAEIFDTVTGTLIARTRSFPTEEFAFNAAERIMEFLRTEYDFEKNLEEK